LEGLEGLEVLGNATMVPVIIFLTQMVKKRIGDFKYGSDLLALLLSFALCTGWTFYYMSPEEFTAWADGNALFKFKHGIDQIVTGFATWLAASKIYDLGHGNKKRDKAVSTQLEIQLTEKVALQEEIVKLKNGHGDTDEQTKEDPVVSDKLRSILEG
jgi:hypothetical protein